jgi:hypothetical protein
MSSKLTKKYRKNNRRSKSKRGGGDCPKFGNIQCTNWGVLGGCGFDIFVKSDDNTKKRYWVDIEKSQSPDQKPKITKIQLQGGINMEITLAPEHSPSDPLSLLQYFPNGFSLTDGGNVLTLADYNGTDSTKKNLITNALLGDAEKIIESKLGKPPPPAKGGSKNTTKRRKQSKKRKNKN